ncbi:MAG: signal peptidase I [Patescibacteria group bacterium]
MSKKKPLAFLGIIVSALVLVGIFFFLKSPSLRKIVQQESYDPNTIEGTVTGDSLFPLLKDGEKVKIQMGYYSSSTVPVREEIIAYDYAGSEIPIIKIIKGMPGDAWRLEKSGTDYKIFVNNKVLKNSEGLEYLIPENKVKVLQLYADTYPNLPKGAFLILGDKISGTTDATAFGLVDLDDVLGRVNR